MAGLRAEARAEVSLDEHLFATEEMVAGISEWASVESPTTDVSSVNRMMGLAASTMADLGARIERRPGRDGYGDVVTASFDFGGGNVPGVLILCHLDTVHPLGTLAGPLPLRLEGDRLYGPGVFDMKGGVYMACYALKQLLRSNRPPRLPVRFLFIPDEEVGSPSTRELIEEEGRKARYVLVPEPAQEQGKLITGRWAFARFLLRARGRPAHAGATLGQGRSAIREMARQILRIEEMSDPARNVTLSVGTIKGGTFVNVVPLDCTAEVLAVLPTQRDFEEMVGRMLELGATQEDVGFEVRQGPVRPLFEPGEESLALYERAARLASAIGFEPGHGSAGGGSDGNFTGALGIPTLDGLGVCGGGFHTHEEHLLVSSLVPRARLFASLLADLA